MFFRIKKKKDAFEKEEEKSCVFRPEISASTPDLVVDTEIKAIKGVAKFIERQKIANEARIEKELYQRRDIGANWVRKTTVPAEFSLATSVKIYYYNNKQINRGRRKKEIESASNGSNNSSPQKKKLEPHKTKIKELMPGSSEDQVDFDKAKKELHKNIHDLAI